MIKEQIINSIFYPRKHHFQDEKDILINVNNDKIAIRLFLKNSGFPTILFFHGNAEICKDYDEIADMYNNFNINLIVSDYRGYGHSTGKPSKDNLHKDSITVFDYTLNHLKKNKYINKLIVMGRSLGSASASHLMKNRIDLIDGCIIESGFANEYPLLKLMNIKPEDIAFKLTDGFNNLEKIKSFSKPLLIIHAELDDIVPYNQAEIIYQESKSTQKEIFKVKNANHNNIIMVSQTVYFEKIKSFIDSLQ
tara:strand:+ start:3075 stop:3824 length:750 start_codon:yes stop_codon:yes gene_type:complete